jgi:TolA-binding protein
VNEPKSRSTDLEDLSVRARRGSLSETERRNFEHALASSASLSVAHQVGRDFDRIGAVRPGDDELIARVVDKVARAPRTAVARRRGLRLGLALAATLAATSAGAALWSTREKPRESGAMLAHSAAVRGLERPAERRSASDPPSTEPTTVEQPAKSEDVAAPVRAGESRSHVAEAPEPVSAKTLFRDANAARRDGDFGHATALYAELERKFPRSEEARLSHVSVGKLLLSNGGVAEAERHFRTYLGGGGGALAEEALVGRAQSLRALGRAVEERQVWQELLKRFPASVYATRARQRLAEAEP